MSATETRQRLTEYHLYIVLGCSLVKARHPESAEIRATLDSVSEFLRTASSRQIREREKELEVLLARATRMYETVLPRKKSVSGIARDFSLLLKQEPDIWRFGVQNGWLMERFDLARLPQFEDLPNHARVGIGVHAGQVSVEEASLLDDSFFLLVRARASFEAMIRCSNTAAGDVAKYKALTSLNSSVCTYSRLGVLTAAAFVEAFVNSVGWNEAGARYELSEQDKAELRGVHKGRYLSLESKLERMPRILRADKGSPIILSDEKQRREPFISFLRETKEVRDSSMHYAPGKIPILRPPQEWLRMLEGAIKHAVGVAREFWSACYPGRQQPKYLAELYYAGLLQHALDRLAAEEAVPEHDRPNTGLKRTDTALARGPAA